LVICFFVGVLVFYLLKQSCGCQVVEGATSKPCGFNGWCGWYGSECCGGDSRCTWTGIPDPDPCVFTWPVTNGGTYLADGNIPKSCSIKKECADYSQQSCCEGDKTHKKSRCSWDKDSGSCSSITKQNTARWLTV